MTYSDKYGTFFGRLNEDGNVVVLHVEDGSPATTLNTSFTVWPIGSCWSARWDHPEGIIITREDANTLGIEIEDQS